MARTDLDQRFAQFCRSGDPTALGAVFDATAGELLHVALWLTRQRADAEDLVQRTFLAAIEARARFLVGQPVVPWLMGILALEARHLRREQAKAAAPTPERPLPDPTAEVAARELDERVRQIAEQLGEPYAPVLRLHLQHGLNASEIAARLQRSAGTVRTQIVRALELLRQRLPQGFALGAAPLWVDGASGGVARVSGALRDRVLHAARDAAPIPSAFGPLPFGTALMTKKLAALAAVGLALLAALAVWMWPEFEPEALASDPPATVAAAMSAPATTASDPPARAAVAPAAVPTVGALRVTTTWQHDQRPAANIGVTIIPKGSHPALHEQTLVTDDTGSCLFAALAPGEYDARSSHGAGHPVAIAAGATTELPLTCARTLTLRGRVVDAGDRPVADAEVWWFAGFDPRRGYVAVRTGAAGEFALPILDSGYLCARKAGLAASPWRSVPPNLEHPAEVITLRLSDPSANLRGRVLDEARQPIANAIVVAGPQYFRQMPGTRGQNGEFEPHSARTRSGRDGGFLFDALPAGGTSVSAWAEGYAPAKLVRELAAGANPELEIILPRGATLLGVVRDAARQPVAGAVVEIGERHDVSCASTPTGADGSYRLTSLAPGRAEVRVAAGENLRAKAAVTLAAGTATTCDLVLGAGRTLRGRVLDQNGKPLAGLWVQRELWPEGTDDGSQFATTDAAGEFAFTNVAPRPQSLTVRKDMIELRNVRVPADRDEVSIALREGDLATAALRLRVVDTTGAPVVGRLVLNQPGNPRGRLAPIAADGAVELAQMRPGGVTLSVQTERIVVPLASVELRPHERRDLGDLVIPAAARLRVRTTHADGKPIRGGWIAVVDDAGQNALVNPPELRGSQVDIDVPAGRWTLLVNAMFEPRATAAVPFEVDAGATRELRVTLPACRRVPIALTFADDSVCGMAHVLVRDAQGGVSCVATAFPQADGKLRVELSLPPGNYTVTTRGPDGCAGAAQLVVPETGEAEPSPTLPTVSILLTASARR